MIKKLAKFIGVACAVFFCFLIVDGIRFVREVSRRGLVGFESQQLEIFIIGAKEFYDEYNRLPASENEVIDFCRTNQETSLSLDFGDVWHTNKKFIKQGDTIEVISAGPDKKFQTPDDLAIKVKLPADLYNNIKAANVSTKE